MGDRLRVRLQPSIPKVVIVGRPNVGKSTLFNRLVGRRKAIVHLESGTTRDRLTENVNWKGREFLLVDTGGLRLEKGTGLEGRVETEASRALAEGDVVLWVVDGRVGCLGLDSLLSEKLRRTDKPVILVVNKMDDPNQVYESGDFYSLGLERSENVSATHGLGIGELLDQVTELLPKKDGLAPPVPLLGIAVVGEPNVGKSTYFNALLGEERSIVSQVPGTTRDSIEEFLDWNGQLIKLVDTAGLRRRQKVKDAATFFSLARTRGSIRGADIVLLIFDAYQGFLENSKRIFRLIQEQKKGCVLVGNKWDLVEKKDPKSYETLLKARVRFLTDVPVEFVSSSEKRNITGPLVQCQRIWKLLSEKIPEQLLSDFLKQLVARRRPRAGAELKALQQKGTRPPHFIFLAKRPRAVDRPYMSFVRHQMIQEFGLSGVPLKIDVEAFRGSLVGEGNSCD